MANSSCEDPLLPLHFEVGSSAKVFQPFLPAQLRYFVLSSLLPNFNKDSSSIIFVVKSRKPITKNCTISAHGETIRAVGVSTVLRTSFVIEFKSTNSVLIVLRLKSQSTSDVIRMQLRLLSNTMRFSCAWFLV